MKVLLVASEGVPFIKTGGLADVIGSLPKELKRQGIDVSVILPLYEDIPQHFKEKMILKKQLTIPLGWRKQYCGIKELEHEGINFYFIDNEYYFKRSGLYEFADNAECYAFFSRAVLEGLPFLDFKPDILHGNDWQTGMVSVFLKAHYSMQPFYKDIKSVFTIHNLKYQGVFPKVILGDILDLSEDYFTIAGIEFYGNVSYLKGGLVFADLLTTVSETYAGEIQTPFFGEGLDGLLRTRKNDLYGIINGIDDSCSSLEGDVFALKRSAKREVQNTLGLPENEEIPVISIVSRLVGQKGLDLVEGVLDEIMALGVQMIVLGRGEERYENFFGTAAKCYPAQLSVNITFDATLATKIYLGSDLFLMPSLFEPCGLGQLIALRNGTIPIVRETGGLKDTIQPFNGEGNGFSFKDYNPQDMLYTIKRAISFYYQKDIWNKIIQKAIHMDYGWGKSARRYRDLYEKLVK